MKNLTSVVYHAKFLGAVVLFLLVINYLNVYIYIHEFKGEELLKVSFLNIGQGDAILIQTPSKQTMLIDGGPVNGGLLSQISKNFPFYRRNIDIVLETHPDADHIGGLPDVVKNYYIGTFFTPDIRSSTSIDTYLHNLLVEHDVLKIKARKGISIVLDPKEHIVFEIFFPDRDVSDWIETTNDASVVGKLTYGSKSLLFTGDSPIVIEQYLLKNISKEKLNSDVLKVGHHGSRTSTSDEFVSIVSPRYGVISDKFQNRYGHPHVEVLKILEKYNVEILRTDMKETITFYSNGSDLEYKTER